MRQFKVTHDAKAVLVVWWCLVTIGSGLMVVDETAALENAKAIKVEKLLTLIRVSELEAEYDALTQKYVSEYEQQIRKSIGSTYSNLTGNKRRKSNGFSTHSCRTSGNQSGRLSPSTTI